MRFNDEQLSILRSIQAMGEAGLSKTTLAKLVSEFFPGFAPHLEKRMSQFLRMRLIDCRNEIIMRKSSASRVEYFALNDRGSRAITAALRNRAQDAEKELES